MRRLIVSLPNSGTIATYHIRTAKQGAACLRSYARILGVSALALDWKVV